MSCFVNRFPGWCFRLILMAGICEAGSSAAVFAAGGTQPKSYQKDLYGDPLPELAIVRFGTLQFRHPMVSNLVAFSPNGKMIASGGGVQPIRLWKSKTGEELASFFAGNIQSIAFSPKTDVLACGGQYGKIMLWDLKSKQGRLVSSPQKSIEALRYSPEGKVLVSVGRHSSKWHSRICFLNSFTGKTIYSRDLKTWILSFAISPDGSVLSLYGEKNLRMFRIPSGKEIFTFKNNPPVGRVVDYSADGKYLVIANARNAYLWDLGANRVVRAFRASDVIWCLRCSPKQALIATGNRDGVIQLWDVKTGKVVRCLQGGHRQVEGLAFSPDGKKIASVGRHQRLVLWKVNGDKVSNHVKGHQTAVTSSAWSPSGKVIATASGGGTVRLWNAKSGRLIHQLRFTDCPIETLAFSPDGRKLAIGGGDPFIYDNPADNLFIWNVPTRKIVRQFRQAYRETVFSVAITKDGKNWAYTKHNGVEFRHSATGKIIYRIPFEYPTCIALSDDGRKCAVAGNESSILLWDLGKRRVERKLLFLPKVFDFPVDPVNCLVFSPNGKMLASVKYGRPVRLWETRTGVQRAFIGAKDMGITTICFGAGRRLITGGDDGNIRIWDIITGKQIGILRGHKGAITCCKLSPCGNKLVTASEDTTALLWNWRKAVRIKKKVNLKPPSTEQLGKMWRDLGNAEPMNAYAAIKSFVLSPTTTISFFQKKLEPVPMVELPKIAKLIADLNSSRFTKRVKAFNELKRYGKAIEPHLQKTLGRAPKEVHKQTGTLELQMRVLKLMKQFAGNSSKRMRESRAIEILEYIGNADSHRMLQQLSRGDLGAPLTKESKDALKRWRFVGTR